MPKMAALSTAAQTGLAKKIELLLKRGPHRSGLVKKATIQLCAETQEKIKHGYARVVRWGR